MNTSIDPADRRRAGFRRFLKLKGLSPSDLAREIRLVSPNAIFNFLSGKSASLSLDTIERIVAAHPDFGFRDLVGLTPKPEADLRDRTGDILPADALLVSYQATCGVWRPQPEAPVEQWVSLPLPAALGDTGDKIFGTRLVMPGPDLLYAEGSILLCRRLDAIDLSNCLAGARYIVQRRRRKKFEVTVRELRLSAGAAWLWPCSTTPQFQEPLRLTAADAGPPSINDDVPNGTVFGMVLASWQPERIAWRD